MLWSDSKQKCRLGLFLMHIFNCTNSIVQIQDYVDRE